MDDLVASCPSIMYLSIEKCCGMSDFRLSGFMKLGTFRILNGDFSVLHSDAIINKVMVDGAPSLHTFEYRGSRYCSFE